MPQTGERVSGGVMALLSTIFFYWGVLTSINSALVPWFRVNWSLSWQESMLVNVAFYCAPFAICLPCSGWMRKRGYRKALLLAVSSAVSGAGVILLSLWFNIFAVCLVGIFILAMGVAAMQVVANPWVAKLGAVETAPGRLSVASSINSVGATCAPALLGTIFLFLSGALAVIGVYAALILAGLLLLCLINRLQQYDVREVTPASGTDGFLLWRQSQFRAGVLGIFIYVGVEVSLGTTTLSYLSDESLAAFSPSQATTLIALYWGGALAGRMLYGVCSARCNTRLLFCLCSGCAMTLVMVAMLLGNRIGGYCLLATGLMNSVMYPVLFSRTLCGLEQYAAKISACLIMAGIGGGVLPFVQGMMIDAFGMTLSFCVPLACYAFLLWSVGRKRVATKQLTDATV